MKIEQKFIRLHRGHILKITLEGIPSYVEEVKEALRKALTEADTPLWKEL